MLKNKRDFGSRGEEVSSRYLENIGYKILERNFNSRQGEIDIIAKDRNEYVFIEVKTRSNMLFGMPREAVDEKKQKHIYKTAKFFLHIHGLDNAYVRFDVIEIYLEENKYQLRHLKNVDINHKM